MSTRQAPFAPGEPVMFERPGVPYLSEATFLGYRPDPSGLKRPLAWVRDHLDDSEHEVDPLYIQRDGPAFRRYRDARQRWTAAFKAFGDEAEALGLARPHGPVAPGHPAYPLSTCAPFLVAHTAFLDAWAEVAALHPFALDAGLPGRA